ncbi:hypothetical protein ASPACDRAFT_1855521 [Aspergillus aculeatus ATCC 16872]|uniref:Uncharacterized protein n=1 Tax=Aspergillus aculeatus (strain ATCC 16872 / CBS 172.66 / WB 5094) TaxID=690307 RepID=A0A1L9WXQ1_ASPA1|nr:uncharacterized protein ASPACDRAFT_1855521 [Aspergillus aculeatus ATCC 16872]OJK00990.1 hypothetical protein ASPACDRAFT_1855521 [Aspergillus aculeatus ATCC 16872]
MSLFSKTIHITAHPAPRTLSDSKLILSALQKFGEVVTFRNLRYDITNPPTATSTSSTTARPQSHSIIAIYESVAAATAACAASPLAIPLTPDAQAQAQAQAQHHSPQAQSQSQSQPQAQAQPQPQPQSQAQTKQKQYYTPLPLPPQQQHAALDTATHYPSTQNHNSLPSEQPDEDPTTIRCTLTASRINHAAAIRRNPWSAGFEIERTSHPQMYEDLVRVGIPLRELADGPAGRKKAVAQPHGRRQRMEAETVRWGAASLMGLFGEGHNSNGGGGGVGRRSRR